MKTEYYAINLMTGSIRKCSSRYGIGLRVASMLISDYWRVPLGYGGMIVLSTDINAKDIGGSRFKQWVVKLAMTIWNRFWKNSKVDKVMTRLIEDRNIETGWSVGNLFKGRYLNPKTGESFDEKSFAIDLRGVDMEFVEEVAKRLMREFKQHSVLLINHKSGHTELFGE